jgi:hypothetical protein
MAMRVEGPKRGPMLSRWSAILSGAAVGLGAFFAVMTFWLIFVADGRGFFVRNLDWFVLGTALFAAAVTGYVAGYVEDWRGAGVGMWNGIASWALIIVGASMFVLPNFLRPLTASRNNGAPLVAALDTQTMIVICIAFLGGVILAGSAAAWSASSRRSKRLFRITPQAEREFLDEITRARFEEVTTIVE